MMVMKDDEMKRVNLGDNEENLVGNDDENLDNYKMKWRNNQKEKKDECNKTRLFIQLQLLRLPLLVPVPPLQ